MLIKAYGEAAVLIEFEQKISPEIHQQVQSLLNAVINAKLAITQAIPAYCSLTLTFDPKRVNFEELKSQIESLELSSNHRNNTTRQLTIPACYELGIDFDELEQELKISREDIIETHSSQTYQVYMLGFLPGFPYLGVLDKSLHCSRKAIPRTKVPARSIAIAGQQTGIYPSEAPGGWQIIARTPVDIFNISTEFPFLFQTGDSVSFKAISKDEYQEMRSKVEAGKFDWESLFQ